MYNAFVNYCKSYFQNKETKEKQDTCLKVIHPIGQSNNKAWVIGDGFITENDIHTVIEVSEVFLSCRELAVIIFWVIPTRANK